MKFILRSRIWLVALGVGLGFLARFVLGGPESNELMPRQFSTPFVELEETADEVESIDVPYQKKEAADSEQGLVPPIRVPGIEASSGMLDHNRLLVSVERSFDSFVHGTEASFEAHGEEVCASGCAASRHPTSELTKSYFDELLLKYCSQPMSQDSPALEELLYFGPQTKKLIEQHGFSPLDSDRATLLWDELKITHAKISIRVIDEAGDVRTWLEPTRVPFDRRHVFKMETKNLQPLVTSGTVKRVGLDHIWVRL